MKSTLNHIKMNKRLLFTLLFTCVFAAGSYAQQYVNLLKNPGINVDAANWTFTIDNGTGHQIVAGEGLNGTGAIQAGYSTAMVQDIDLLAAGYSEAFLDEAPIIRFSDWIKGAGPDLTDFYYFSIELKDAADNVLAEYNSYNDIGYTETGAAWKQVTHTMLDYGPGVRKISILRGSVDGEYDQTATVGALLDAAWLSINNHAIYGDSKTGDLAGWTVTQDGGDGWKASDTGFQTSYSTCVKSQTINFLDLGYTQAQLDTEPRVNFWEFYIGDDGPGNGTGIGDLHFMNTELRDGAGNVLASFNSGDLTAADSWQEVYSFFENYGVGMQELYIEHGGFDAEFWAGNYGAFIDATTVTLDFAPPSAVKEIEAQNHFLAVFPNPVFANDQIRLVLETERTGDFQVELTDVMGRKMFQSEFTKQGATLDTGIVPEGLATGVYLLSVRQGEFVATQRVVVR